MNGAKALAKDGEHGMGNRFRTLLNDAARSPRHWAAFRRAVAQAGLVHTGAWVAHWNAQLTAQTAWRKTIPAHYSTGALDPKSAEVRQMLERRRWTFRNLTRMSHLLELIRLHLERQDSPTDWAKGIREELARIERGEPFGPDGAPDFGRRSTRVVPMLKEQAIDAALREGLLDGFCRFQVDPEAAVLVSTGDGEAFCAGGDLDLSAEHPRSQAYEHAERLLAPVSLSHDAQQGPRAFREKRPPLWKGR